MAADATASLAGLQVCDASHGLNRSVGFIHGLEIQRLTGGGAEICRTIRLYGNRAKHHAGALGIGKADLRFVSHMRRSFW